MGKRLFLAVTLLLILGIVNFNIYAAAQAPHFRRIIK
jgi:hypothetical protein